MATIESRAGLGIPLVFLVSYVFIATCVLVIFVRRWTAAKQSGGPFTAPFHIARGMFYIHVAFCFKKRRIPLASIRRILIDFMRGRKGGGARYVVRIEQKDGTTTMFFMGKNKATDALLEQLPQAVKRYPIKVSLK
ncbi:MULTISPECIES: hypothetical protein [unclassified Granulicatella]|uniref:hypothetical protein n=1 Tax=unclassified Granulicatella TaxID=2630493 RepID=UPI002557395D|nr:MULTISPECIES: hypothetical protein [unclassified Granulicatella]MDK8380310.1 hypothetical protein [Granulicatella sp. UMB5615B]MDK8523447.1 hypothetical protein [Granulicatella sp. UMB5615A]